jgi:ABC-2 type transport system ATP-binding protein
MTEAIRIDALGKRYPSSWRTPSFEAVRDVTLAVEPGEVFGFIGPNGAGKSTTIKILTGVLRPTAGSARLFGVDVALPEARRGMGYVPENPSLYDYLTPAELLEMGQQIHGVPRGDIDRNTRFWLERFGIADVADKRIRSFSKGMVQRVALAHALAVRPRLLILDEPLSGLDPVGRKDVVDILDDYRKAGGAIFLTSHVLHDVERLADRFGLINHGRLVTVQSRAGLLDGEQKLAVHSAGDEGLDGFIADAPGRWRKTCKRADLWSVLDALRSAGHTVLEIRPALALEDVFFKFIGEDEPIAEALGGEGEGSAESANAKT